MIKQTDNVNGWGIYDNKRGWSKALLANTDGTAINVPITVQGTQMQIPSSSWGAGNYIYMAIAEPTTRSLTQEEFAEQALKFATYDNRKHVQCGEQAQADRDALITQMANAGYDLDDILKYL